MFEGLREESRPEPGKKRLSKENFQEEGKMNGSKVISKLSITREK